MTTRQSRKTASLKVPSGYEPPDEKFNYGRYNNQPLVRLSTLYILRKSDVAVLKKSALLFFSLRGLPNVIM